MRMRTQQQHWNYPVRHANAGQVQPLLRVPPPPPPVSSGEGGTVLLLKNVNVDTNMSVLQAAVEKALSPGKVTRMLRVWTKGVILVEMSSPVHLPSRTRVPHSRGVTMEVSDKQDLDVPAACPLLNVKFFNIHPTRDERGSEVELPAYLATEKQWAERRRPGDQVQGDQHTYVQLGQELQAFSGERWCELLLPHYPRHVTTHYVPTSRRMYTQLVFMFQDVDAAARALRKGDGAVFKFRGLTVVARLDFADPRAIASAPRIANPNFMAYEDVNSREGLSESQGETSEATTYLEEEDGDMPQLIDDEDLV